MASLALRLCALVLLPFFLCFTLFPSLVLGILTDLPEVISDAKPSFYVMVLAYALTTPAYLYFFCDWCARLCQGEFQDDGHGGLRLTASISPF